MMTDPNSAVPEQSPSQPNPNIQYQPPEQEDQQAQAKQSSTTSHPIQTAQPTPMPEYGQYAPTGSTPTPQYQAPAQHGGYAPQQQPYQPQQTPYTPQAQAQPYAAQQPYEQQQPYAQQQAYSPYGQQQQPYGQQMPYGQQQPSPQSGAPIPQGVPQYVSQSFIGDPSLDKPFYGISFGKAIARFYQKYATFSGRASRGEFWWAALFIMLVGFVLNIFTAFLPSPLPTIITTIWALSYAVPLAAVSVRRLHDGSHTGWWALIYFIPWGIQLVLNIVLPLFFPAVMPSLSFADLAYDSALLMAWGAFGLVTLVCDIVFLCFMASSSNPYGAAYDVPESGTEMPQNNR
ncbi:DUF805 domain-containing protein [Bifidobacterium tsurumiense]|nr:DUF805 domain-containing protein [Bifidobacterium tsurumiense]